MNRVQIRFIKDAMDQPESLTEWEREFVNSLAERGDDYELSTKQNEILNRISQKVE